MNLPAEDSHSDIEAIKQIRTTEAALSRWTEKPEVDTRRELLRYLPSSALTRSFFATVLAERQWDNLFDALLENPEFTTEVRKRAAAEALPLLNLWLEGNVSRKGGIEKRIYLAQTIELLRTASEGEPVVGKMLIRLSAQVIEREDKNEPFSEIAALHLLQALDLSPAQDKSLLKMAERSYLRERPLPESLDLERHVGLEKLISHPEVSDEVLFRVASDSRALRLQVDLLKYPRFLRNPELLRHIFPHAGIHQLVEMAPHAPSDLLGDILTELIDNYPRRAVEVLSNLPESAEVPQETLLRMLGHSDSEIRLRALSFLGRKSASEAPKGERDLKKSSAETTAERLVQHKHRF